MTVHAAKGLELKNVFVVGLEEELFPSSMSKDNPRAVEEERRLFYVAITRAEENCVLTYAKSRFRNGQSAMCSPSRFLKDIDVRFLDVPADSSADTLLLPANGSSVRHLLHLFSSHVQWRRKNLLLSLLWHRHSNASV